MANLDPVEPNAGHPPFAAQRVSYFKVFTAAFLGRVASAIFIAACVALGFGPTEWVAFIVGSDLVPWLARVVFVGLGAFVFWLNLRRGVPVDLGTPQQRLRLNLAFVGAGVVLGLLVAAVAIFAPKFPRHVEEDALVWLLPPQAIIKFLPSDTPLDQVAAALRIDLLGGRLVARGTPHYATASDNKPVIINTGQWQSLTISGPDFSHAVSSLGPAKSYDNLEIAKPQKGPTSARKKPVDADKAEIIKQFIAILSHEMQPLIDNGPRLQTGAWNGFADRTNNPNYSDELTAYADLAKTTTERLQSLANKYPEYPDIAAIVVPVYPLEKSAFDFKVTDGKLMATLDRKNVDFDTFLKVFGTPYGAFEKDIQRFKEWRDNALGKLVAMRDG
jgi:hypothetical protein